MSSPVDTAPGTGVVTLEVFADIACPWCFIGKRRLKQALADEAPGGVEVAWRAYELQPGIPPEGLPLETFGQKFGSPERMRQAFAQVAEIGRADGIAFNFDAMHRAPNTRRAHRLAILAGEQGPTQRETMMEALFSAHFEQGRDVGDVETLVDLAAETGLDLGADQAELRARLLGDAGLDTLEAEESEAGQLGISGVPFFVGDRRYGLSGAQPPEVIRQFLEAVRGRQD